MTLQESKKLPHFLKPCYQVVSLKLVFNCDLLSSGVFETSFEFLHLFKVACNRYQLDFLIDFRIYRIFMIIPCVQLSSFLSKTKERFL